MSEEIQQEQLQAVRDLLDDEPAVRHTPRLSEEDKKQLVLAAKAYGLEVVRWTDTYMDCGYHSERYGQPGLVVLVNGLEELWNPLTDDGDALRLAVACRLTVCTDGDGTVSACEAWLKTGAFATQSVRECTDKQSATRRAIVRCAAEIGANMQS